MALTKKQRQLVWEKSCGKCWYCGRDLSQKGWHADHVESVIRVSKLVRGGDNRTRFVGTGEMHREHNDKIENIVPACAPCNLFKSTFSLEYFRQEIEEQIERARKTSVNFRTAERFGLIETKPCKVIFWFEKQGL